MKESPTILFLRSLVILFICIVTLLPIAWIVINSLKGAEEIFKFPPTLWPSSPTLSNYSVSFTEFGFAIGIRNSIIVSSCVTGVAIIFGLLAAYSFSRFKYVGNATILILVLVFRMIPPVSIIVPLYSLATILHLRNTLFWLGIMGIAFALPTAIWVFKIFMDDLPDEFFDAARIDGCSNTAIFYRLIIPLSRNAIVILSVLTFPSVWGEFLLSRTFLKSSNGTLPVVLEPLLVQMKDTFGIHWGHAAAGAMIMLIPLIPIVIFLQKYLVSGLTGGVEIKG